MKFIGWLIGFGLGAVTGALVVHNCKKARQKLAEAQDAIVEKIEEKKRQMFQSAPMQAEKAESAHAAETAAPKPAPPKNPKS